METILITGGTGLIGHSLSAELLKAGYQVIILSRKAGDQKKIPTQAESQPGIEYAVWNVNAQTIDIAALQRADHIIHLAGAGVMDKKWTTAYKKEIIDSRTKSSELIIDALKKNTNKVRTVISSSATGWYTPDEPGKLHSPHIENEPADNSFLGETCRLWESSIQPVTALGKRLVIMRTGIVLSNHGGALKEFKMPLKFKIAAILGNGKQMISWIHIDDLCRMFMEAIKNENLSGSYNAVAPFPVTNKELTLELAKQCNGNFFIPVHVPAFILKIMMGDRSIEILKSANISNEKITAAGFVFTYKTIEDALRDLCRKESKV
ncbi:MAG: TIGR01777 family oxidoreductase [Ferruginibacter sp.]